jgi:TonB family protein
VSAEAESQTAPYNPMLTTLDIGGQERRDSKAGFSLSIALHVATAVFILVKTVVFPDHAPSYSPTLRVDIVELPDALRQELKGAPKASSEIENALKKAEADAKKMKPVAPKIEDQAEPDELVLKPKEGQKEKPVDRDKKLKSALARIRSLEKLEAAENETAKPVVIKGNAISKGTSLSGDAKEAAEASYYDLVRDKLHENWALPVWLSRQNHSAQVLILLDASGRLKGVRFVKSSGNAQFDEAVKRTIAESDPFPRPPKELVSAVESGIPAGFPL